MGSSVADLGAHAWRTVVDECAARPELFSNGERVVLREIAMRLERGLVLSPNEQAVLERCESRLIYCAKWRVGDKAGGSA